MISIPDTNTLKPKAYDNDGRIALFSSQNTDLVKIDILFEAGSAYQVQPLCASAASKLYTLATRRMDSAQVSEFMDFRGIIIETSNEVLQSVLTVYTLRRHVGELLPLILDMFQMPAFAEEDYTRWQRKRHEEIATLEQRTAHIARRLFYQALFGNTHPLGVYATADDVYKLQLNTVVDHWRRHYNLSKCKVVLAGNIEENLAAQVSHILGTAPALHHPLSTLYSPLPQPAATSAGQTLTQKMPTATQTSIRIGRYGIYARTQIYRGCIVFYITADVAANTADDAIGQVFHEIEQLVHEPVSDEELTLVKNVLVGDFLRSVDGIFELSSRYCDMQANGIDERLTDNLRTAIKDTTATELQELAQRLLRVEDMTVCTAGV